MSPQHQLEQYTGTWPSIELYQRLLLQVYLNHPNYSGINL